MTEAIKINSKFKKIIMEIILYSGVTSIYFRVYDNNLWAGCTSNIM